jgi:hypothetical protein
MRVRSAEADVDVPTGSTLDMDPPEFLLMHHGTPAAITITAALPVMCRECNHPFGCC